HSRRRSNRVMRSSTWWALRCAEAERGATRASAGRRMAEAPLIAHVIYRLDYGGLENGLVNLVNHLPRAKYRHAIVCLAGFTDFRKRIQRDDVEVISIDKQPGKDPAAYGRLWRQLRRLRPAVVHTRNL